MRRGSITGPIILIAIGVLFLIDNIRPELPLWSLFAQYWPFLLIIWGVLRLVEILISAGMSKQVPSRGLGGGEWLLIVLICIFGTGAFFAHRHFSHFPPTMLRNRIMRDFGESYDYTVAEKKVSTGKTPRVLIENFDGNARIVGSDADEVKVSGRKTVRAWQRNEADEADRLTQLEVVNQGDVIVVRSNQERASGDRKVSDDLDITVPKGASVEGRGRMGDFDISDLTGNVDVISDNAGVRAQNIGGNFRVDLHRSDIIRGVNVKGAVDVKGHGSNLELENIDGPVTVNGGHMGDLVFRNLAKQLRMDDDAGSVRVERCPGSIKMTRGSFSASDFVGPLQLSAKSKDVDLADFTQTVEVQVDRGDLTLRPGKLPLAKIDARTRNGLIELSIPPNAKFTLRAEAMKGDVVNDWGSAITTDAEGKRGGIMRGTVGDGPEITLHSDRGTVTIRKADEVTVTPKKLKVETN
jgi:hypothetical protein